MGRIKKKDDMDHLTQTEISHCRSIFAHLLDCGKICRHLLMLFREIARFRTLSNVTLNIIENDLIFIKKINKSYYFL